MSINALRAINRRRYVQLYSSGEVDAGRHYCARDPPLSPNLMLYYITKDELSSFSKADLQKKLVVESGQNAFE